MQSESMMFSPINGVSEKQDMDHLEKVQEPKLRSHMEAPLRKLSVNLLGTYKTINQVDSRLLYL